MIDATFAFVLIAGIIFFGFGAEIFFRKTGIPHFLFLIAIGVLMGPLLGLVSGNSFIPVLGFFSTFTLMMVLFYNGMQMEVREVMGSSSRVLLQVVLYVLVSVVAIAAVAHLILGWDVLESLIFGTIIGGETTAVIMMRIPRALNQSSKVITFLGLESVMNSIFLVVLFFVFLSVYQTGATTVNNALAVLASNISVGIIFGFALSTAWILVLNYLKDYRYTYVFTLGLLLTTYVLAQISGGSGLMAVLVFGIMLGNYKSVGSFLRRELKMTGLESQLRSFQEEISFLLETFFFVFLGLIFVIRPSEIVSNFLTGALFVAILLAVRYMAVNISTKGSELSKDKTMITFMCAQGLTPAILAIVALTDNLPLANSFVSIVVFVIIITNVVTAVDAYFTMKSGRKDGAQPKPKAEPAAPGEKKREGKGAVTI